MKFLLFGRDTFSLNIWRQSSLLVSRQSGAHWLVKWKEQERGWEEGGGVDGAAVREMSDSGWDTNEKVEKAVT